MLTDRRHSAEEEHSSPSGRLADIARKSIHDGGGIRFQFALPYGENHPARRLERSHVALISVHIRIEFCLPELRSGRGHSGVSAAFMPMPEASVHEDGSAVSRQDYIRLSREFF